MMKNAKAGFTLAEVLTTLMVIGVVAAMTIPTLMNSTQNQQSAVAAKKAASVLGQAIQLLMSKEESCTIGTTNPSNELAACMSKVMSGSRTDNKIVTADGMAYRFYAPSISSAATFQTVCGEAFLSSKGAGSCGVVVDTNGEGKTTKTGYPETSAFTSSGFTTNPQMDTDVIAFSLNSQSIKPIVWDGTDAINNTTKLLYGKEGTATDSKICVKTGATVTACTSVGSGAYAIATDDYSVMDSGSEDTDCPSGYEVNSSVKAVVGASCPTTTP